VVSRLGFPDTRWSMIGRLALEPSEASVVMDLYSSAIARYLRRKFPQEVDLEDVIQEVLVHLFEHPELMSAAQPGGGSRFRYLLMTLAWNEARNRLRERRRRQHRERTATPETVNEHTSGVVAADHGSMDRAWAESLLAQAWTDLRGWASDGTLEREIPALLQEHLVRGRNLRDIAAELRLPLATCHRRLARGRTYLQKAIVDRLCQAGELVQGGDPASACALLMDILAG
jgi:RNA polymerase sigma factor (sigma-70 family)